MISKAQEDLYQVIRGTHVTEKAVSGSEANIYVFKVSVGSTKLQIRKAVESLFEVDVVSVKSLNVSGKKKNFGRRQGLRKNWKKAYVRLAEGQSLGVEAEG